MASKVAKHAEPNAIIPRPQRAASPSGWVKGRRSRYPLGARTGGAIRNQVRLHERGWPGAKLICIDLQPYTTTQAPDRSDILNVGGFSDVVFQRRGRLPGRRRRPVRGRGREGRTVSENARGSYLGAEGVCARPSCESKASGGSPQDTKPGSSSAVLLDIHANDLHVAVCGRRVLLPGDNY